MEQYFEYAWEHKDEHINEQCAKFLHDLNKNFDIMAL